MELKSLLETFLGLQFCSKRCLLSLLEKLNFAASVVITGRTFMRCLWDAALTIPELHYISTEARPDMPSLFAPLAVPVSQLERPLLFLQPLWCPAPQMHLYTDAAGSIRHGAFFDGL